MAELEGIDAVIITALPIERDAVLRRLPSPERRTTKGRVVYRAVLPTRVGNSYAVVLLPLSGVGTASAATATTQAVDVWNPRHLFLTGIAGGVKKAFHSNAGLGDVVVAEQIVGYEHGKLRDAGTARRYEAYRPSHALLNKAREFAQTEWPSRVDLPRPDSSSRAPQVHFGVVGAGDKVIANEKFVGELFADWPRLMGVEMEGLGVALAAYQAETAPGVLLVKAISDWADSSKADDWQPYAADVAAAFLCAFLEDEPFPPGGQSVQAARVQAVSLSGRHKIRLCQRLGDDWYDLADYFDIPQPARRRFPQGRECQAIWEWLDNRSKLEGLPQALRFIGRDELANMLSNASVT